MERLSKNGWTKRHGNRRPGITIPPRKTSRAELIRQAVAGYLAQNRAGLEESFGMWKGRGVDGVEYQERLRRGWERGV